MRPSVPCLAVLLPALLAGALPAGDSGLNVFVVANANSSNSLALANAYCEQRGVPPQNVLRLTGWTGGAVQWARTDFENYLRNPLLTALAQRGLTGQVDVVLLSMDLPYRVTDGGSQNSTTAALFYGFKFNTPPPQAGLPGTCCLPDASANSYAFSELPFRLAPPDTATNQPFLAFMLTDSSLAQANRILARGAASDATFPTQTVYLEHTTDAARSVRYFEFDDALLDARVRGAPVMMALNSNSTTFTNCLGLLTGLAGLSLPANAFVPGAIGDSLTSYAGMIFENTGQTPLLAFLDAGAAASYGTITEPCNFPQKFPSPRDYFYQARGFNAAESYYQSVQNPFQGLMVGEPLAAPFAQPGVGDWIGLPDGSVLQGQAALSLQFAAARPDLPLQQVDLFLDGTFLQTVTNLPPTAGNSLTVALNGTDVPCVVPTNASIAAVAAALADALNAVSNSTRVAAVPVGDRLTLAGLDVATPGSNLTLSATAAVGSASQQTTFLTAARTNFLDSAAAGLLYLYVTNAPAVGDWLQLQFTKTNGTVVTVAVTNNPPGADLGTLVQSLVNRVNSNPALQTADGLYAADFGSSSSPPQAECFLHARSAGWPAAEIQTVLTAATNLTAQPGGTNFLETNLSDLQPRNHLYVSAGAAALPVTFTLDTTTLPDGFHQLTAVAYEGTSVRTQTRVTRNIQIQNTTFSATLTPLVGDTNTALEATLQFAVSANAPTVARAELFTTGGSVGVVSNQATAIFSVAAATLGLGLHPFYAVVTDNTGHQFRTAPLWFRVVGAEAPFQLVLTNPPPALVWPALAGRRYDILAATNLAAAFQPVASVIASNNTGQWLLPTGTAPATFFRVRSSP